MLDRRPLLAVVGGQATPQGQQQGNTQMIKWVIRIWVGVAIILPCLFGIMLLAIPGQMPTLAPTVTSAAGTAGADALISLLFGVAGMAGARDIIYSGLIIAALRLLEPKALGVLIVGRGFIDLSDGLQSLVKGQSAGAMPLVFGVISFVVAYLILRQPVPTAAPTPTSSWKGR
jgi:hypothetical protein